jgi:hypothetical protein
MKHTTFCFSQSTPARNCQNDLHVRRFDRCMGNSPIRMGPLLVQEALPPQETNSDTPRPDLIASNFGYYEYGRFCSIADVGISNRREWMILLNYRRLRCDGIISSD